MSRASVLARGRAAAEAGMVDTCTVEHPTGESTGPGGIITATYAAPYYTGKCQVQTKAAPGQGAGGQGTDVGEAHLILTQKIVKLPMSVLGVREGDRVTITAATHDPDLAGRVYTVRDVEAKTFLTARRITVTEVTS